MSPRTTTTRPRVFLYLDSLKGPGRVGSLYVCICLYCQYVKTSNAQEMWLYGEKLVFWRIIAFLSDYATKIVAIRRRKSAGHVTKIVYKFHVNADFSPHSFWLVKRTHPPSHPQYYDTQTQHTPTHTDTHTQTTQRTHTQQLTHTQHIHTRIDNTKCAD